MTTTPGFVTYAPGFGDVLGLAPELVKVVDLEVQRALDIREYTDPHHAATVPHTLVLAPGLVIDKVYVGYWFWGRPSPHQLGADLQDLHRRMKPDFDPTVPHVRDAWLSDHEEATKPRTAAPKAPRARR